MKKYVSLLFLFLILSTGIFLRTYKILDNYYFSGELGKEMLYMRDFVVNSRIPLTGMATSHEWLSYGPVYYWIMIPLYLLFNGNPFILFWSALTVSFLGLILNFFVIRKIADKNLATVSTAIMALSPLLIWQTRLSKLHVFFWIVMPLFMLFIYRLWQGKKNWVFPTGILFGILFSFHFSQIPLLGVVFLLFYIKRKIYKFDSFLKFGIGVLIPNLTYIWKNLTILLWLPYRVLNVENKNPNGTLNLLNEYFGKNIFWDNRLWISGSLILFVVFIHYFLKYKNKFKKDFLPFYLISSITIMILANVLHGAPPVHYFLPIFTTVPILLAVYLEKIKMWPLLLMFVVLINLMSFNKDPVFYLKFDGNIPTTDFVNYETQQNIATFITLSSKGKELSIKRVGPYDYFPDNYSQNYKYLVLRKGGNVVQNSANLYTIIESSEGIHVEK